MRSLRIAHKEQYHVRTVDRALSILKAFIANESEGEFSLTEISRTVSLDQSTTYRLLVTLEASGFIEQSDKNGRYRLGVASLALSEAFLRQNDLCQRANPSLVALRDKCGETVHLAIMEGIEVVYLDKLAGLHPIGLMSSRVGGRSPAHCTGLGKSLLAYYPDSMIRSAYQNLVLNKYTTNTITDLDSLMKELVKIREKGYAVDVEEHEQGVACIASPVFDHRGIAAAISVSGPSDRVIQQISKSNLPQMVIDAAGEISSLLGGRSSEITFKLPL
jgi:DNA-binding IclR family transcriptional regulator